MGPILPLMQWPPGGCGKTSGGAAIGRGQKRETEVEMDGQHQRGREAESIDEGKRTLPSWVEKIRYVDPT